MYFCNQLTKKQKKMKPLTKKELTELCFVLLSCKTKFNNKTSEKAFLSGRRKLLKELKILEANN